MLFFIYRNKIEIKKLRKAFFGLALENFTTD